MVVTLLPATVDSGVTQERLPFIPMNGTMRAERLPAAKFGSGQAVDLATSHTGACFGSANPRVDLPLSVHDVTWMTRLVQVAGSVRASGFYKISLRRGLNIMGSTSRNRKFSEKNTTIIVGEFSPENSAS